jgi:hypothetical protein
MLAIAAHCPDGTNNDALNRHKLNPDIGPVLPTSTSHARPTRVLVIDNERVGVAHPVGG